MTPSGAFWKIVMGLLVFLGTAACWPPACALCAGWAQGRETTSGEFEDHAAELEVVIGRSKLLRSKVDVIRVALVDASICDVIQVSPKEVSILGKKEGATSVTLWIRQAQSEPVHVLVRVKAP
jgi:Flp pilus assembly secretin CpaC